MVRMIMHGCNGKMGQVISAMAAADPECKVTAGVDLQDEGKNPYPVFSSLAECSAEADCVIDFSTAAAVDGLLERCAEKKLPCVLCTTGLSREQLEKVKEVSRQTAILKSANMSLGVNLLLQLLKKAAEVLGPAGFDPEVVEKHHNRKLDAPSGTALALAECVSQALGGGYDFVCDRSTRRERRPQREIGISSIRGGTIVGEHDVIFAGTDEVVTFSHTAYSKAVFGRGALQAAKFLAGKPAGLYDMSDVIREVLG